MAVERPIPSSDRSSEVRTSSGYGWSLARPPSSMTAMSHSSVRACTVSACTAGDRPTTTSCGAGRNGSMYTSSAPSLSHAIGAVTVPSRVVVGELVGRAEEHQPRLAVAERVERLAHDHRLGARAADEPVHGAVVEDDALRAQMSGARARAATRRSRARRGDASCVSRTASARTPASISLWAPAPIRSPTRPGRGATACRCCARRGARARR